MYKLLMFRAPYISNALVNALIAFLLLATAFLPTMVLASEGSDRFSDAYEHYNRGRWQQAADSFATFTNDFPDHSNSAIASFFRAESLLQLKNHLAAGQQYEQFLVDHPGHRYERHAEYRVAETAFLSGQYTKADLELRQFQRRHPDAELSNFVLVYLGETQLALGKPVTAQATFEQALEQFSDDQLVPRFQLGLARAYLAQDKEEGEQLVAKIFDTLPAELLDDAMFSKASYHYRHENFSECEKICRLIVQAYPKSELRPQVDHRLGTTIADQGRFEESARLLVAAARAYPSHKLTAAIWYRAGVTFKQGGHLKAAEHVFARTTELHPASSWSNRALIERLNILRQLDPMQAEKVLIENVRQLRESAEPELRLELARALHRMNKVEESISILRDLSQAPQTPSDITNQAKMLRAEIRLGQQEFESAAQLLKEIDVKESPNISQATVTVMQAQAYYGLENWQAFSAAAHQYLTEDPNGPESANLLAKLVVTEVQQNKFDESLLSYNHYIQHAPDHVGRHEVERVLADNALIQNKYDLAKEFYTKLARDGNPPAYVQRGLLGLGWVEAKLKNMEASARSFDLAAQQSRSNAERERASLSRAQALELAGNLDGALAIYEEIAKQDEDIKRRATAIFRGALIHKHLKQWDEAVTRFEKFTTDFPSHENLPTALYHLAWTLTDRGDMELAELTFRRLTTEHPDSQHGQRARYRLAQEAMKLRNYADAEKQARAILASLERVSSNHVSADSVHSSDAPTEKSADSELHDHTKYLLGKIAIARQNWAEVITHLSPLKDSPHGLNGNSRYLVADATFRLGRLEEATDLFNELVDWPSLQDEQNRALVPLITLRQAQVYSHLGKWQIVKELSTKLREEHQDFGLLYEADYILGRVHFKRGEFTQARIAFERVVRSPQGGQRLRH